MRKRDLWLLGSLAVVLGLIACNDAVEPRSPQSPAVSPPLYSSVAADPEAPPMGIGGSVTITASGSVLPDVPMQASGLTLPPGIPVRVTISGQITRTQTDGLKDFCAFFVDLCEEFAFYLGEDPVPPSGVPVIDAAVAYASWDGGEAQRTPESGPVLTGPSGSELWVGRSQYFCEYSWDFGSGPCFTFGGSYVYTVHADNGDESAHLVLNVTAQSLRAAGGTVDLEVETSDGSPAGNVRWYFVPDGGGVIDGGEPPITAAASERAGAESAPDGQAPRLTILGGAGVRSEQVATVSATPRIAAAATWTSISSCDDALTCHATIDVSTGTFVATALVHGTPRAADARVSAGTGGGGAPQLQVTCVPAQVERGQQVTCTSRLSVDKQFTVVSRAAKGSGFKLEQTTPIAHAAGEVDVWEGQAVATSDVTVVVEVVEGGKTQQLRARAQFTVVPRAWPTWQFTNVVGPFIALAGNMKPAPKPNSPIGLSQPEAPDVTTIALATAATGPNTGLIFVRDLVTLDSWLVGIHPGLEPTPPGLNPGDPGYMPWHRWYDDQNGQGGGTCGPADVLHLRQEVERHEGLTQAANSHFGVANQVLANEQSQARIERLFSDQSEQTLRTLIDGEFQNIFNKGAYSKAQKAFDQQDTPLIFSGLGCTLDFNPNDP